MRPVVSGRPMMRFMFWMALAGCALADVVDHGGDDQAVGTRVEGRGHLAEVRAVDPLGLNGQARREDLDEGLILVEVLVELVNFLVGEVLCRRLA